MRAPKQSRRKPPLLTIMGTTSPHHTSRPGVQGARSAGTASGCSSTSTCKV